ncbi:MAG: hypothetical protein Kow0073_06190 [Immundisolibacter sp.]
MAILGSRGTGSRSSTERPDARRLTGSAAAAPTAQARVAGKRARGPAHRAPGPNVRAREALKNAAMPKRFPSEAGTPWRAKQGKPRLACTPIKDLEYSI